MRALMSALATFTIALVPTLTHAQMACANRDTVVQRLESKYGETFSGAGLQNAQRIFEVWSSEEDGTWTILMTRADGMTCVMASGTDWRDGPVVTAKKGIQG